MSMTPLEIALERIEACRRTRSTELDLSNLGLDAIPEQVFALTWLEKLDVSGDEENWESRNIREIPAAIEQLTALIDLKCSANQISDLSPLVGLPALQALDCGYNQISDLSPLGGLPALQALYCRKNQISDLLPLRGLPALQALYCEDNEISDLSPLGSLPALQALYCSFNQISDLSPLRGLPALQALDCHLNQISDLSPLGDLPALQALDCGYNQISDLSPLSGSPTLQKLDCHDNQISQLTLSGLPALQALNCSSNQISDLSPLDGLPALQALNCSSNQISDLSPLGTLPALQSLSCSSNQISQLTLRGLPALQALGCEGNKISQLTLSDLPALQSLDCSFNQISQLTLSGLPALQSLSCRNNQISDLSPLSGLPALQSLSCRNNQISDLSPLSGLPALQSLGCEGNKIKQLTLSGLPALQSLYCGFNQISQLTLSGLPTLKGLGCRYNQISDLSPLSNLSTLQRLDCRYNQISDLSPLGSLPALQSLDCLNNQISDLSPIQNKVISGQLENLYLYGNPVCGIPSGLLGSNELATCQENLRNYWLDLAKGSERQQQLKVQLVGNGRVGKTTLAYALEHKRAPSAAFKSTHGIVIKEIQQALDGEEQPVTLQLWDFGGQEIYHATHRLFLSEDCLYLLLWAEETDEHPDETRHPVSYWLELIHDLGKTSPIILVKNQIDRSDRLPERPTQLNEDLPGVSQIRYATKVSAMQYRGMPALRGAIEAVLEELKYRVCLELPSSWLEVQRTLLQLHEQKTLPFTHFKQLCIKAGVSQAEWLVGYLHETGALFYRKGAFQDQIILDQNWVIDAVYRVFDPEKQRSFVEDDLKGHFKGRHAKMVWPDAAETEREIYLNFMRNCGICYESKRQQNQQDRKPLAEREFIIPDLLPLTSNTKAAWGDNRPDDWQLDIEFPFLHRSIIVRVILRLGETYEGEPWRSGIFCETGEGQVLLECEYANKQQSTQGRLRFQLRGNPLERLVYALRKLVSETSPHRRYTEHLSKAGKERIQLPEFKEEQAITTRLEEVNPMSNPIKLFISYAQEDDKHRAELEKRLKIIDREIPLKPWSDRQLQPGGLVHQDILRQLEEADIVLLVVTPDFIAKDYCFDREVQTALQRYEQQQNIVIPIIVRETPDWTNYAIGQLTALPTRGKPLRKYHGGKDAFWADVQAGLRRLITELWTKRA